MIQKNVFPLAEVTVLCYHALCTDLFAILTRGNFRVCGPNMAHIICRQSAGEYYRSVLAAYFEAAAPGGAGV
jgi:hypothetical protein